MPARFRHAAGSPPPAGHGAGCGEIVLAGAHGGAGVTTLAAWLQPAWDLGAPRQAAREFPPLWSRGRPVVLVTRNNVAAAGRATAAVNAITSVGQPIAVLAVVSDGLPEPADARYRFRLLQARVSGVVRVPFVAQLRLADPPAPAAPPRRARAAVEEIRAVIRAAHPGPATRV